MNFNFFLKKYNQVKKIASFIPLKSKLKLIYTN